jgi:FKBP-type peptidyl-prolyl cis-trans isomerase SlyD
MQVGNNTVVSLRYLMRNSEGEEVENTFAGSGVPYLHGAGKILPELEAALFGLYPGDRRSISIHTPELFEMDVEIVSVREARQEELASGAPGSPEGCGPGCCC